MIVLLDKYHVVKRLDCFLDCNRHRFFHVMRVVTVAFCFVVIQPIGPAYSQAGNPDVNRALEMVIAKGQFQTEFPHQRETKKSIRTTGNSSDSSTTSNSTDSSSDEEKTRSRRSQDEGLWREFWSQPAIPESGEPVIVPVLWVIIGIVLLILLLYWIREGIAKLPNAQKSNRHQKVRVDTHSSLAPRQVKPMDAISAFARDGHYNEAVRELLLKCVHSILTQSKKQHARSFTNRELLREPNISGVAKSALAVLVASEELCQFGSKQLGESIYTKCLSAFHEFEEEVSGGKSSR